MSVISPGISVVICCYNSSARLPETLKHLAMQIVPENILWEIILINNASTDNTTKVAESEWKKYDHPSEKFKIFDEEKAGLSYARERGARESIYKYLIFCDDDNWLDCNYLFNSYQFMENNPKIGALGGQSFGVTLDNELPEWFENVKNGFAVGSQSQIEGDVSDKCTLWGAGLVTRTEIFLDCFNTEFPALVTDRLGGSLSSGGDDELCFRILLKGFRLYYSENLTFKHFIPPERLTKIYVDRLYKQDRSQVSEILNDYSLLYKLINYKIYIKPIFVVKTFLGYFSSKLLIRNSWSLSNVKALIFFYSKLDLGISTSSHFVYRFYSVNAKK